MNKRIMNNLRTKSPVLWGLVCAGLAIFVWLGAVFVDVSGILPQSDNDEVMVTIPQGATLFDISQILKDEDVIDYPFLFRFCVKASRNDYVFQQGGHFLDKNLSYGKIARELTYAPDISFDEVVTVLIPEGYEAWQIAEVLEKKGLVDKEKFLQELEEGEFDFDFLSDISREENRLEGYLFPATYEFAVWETERDIIIKMLEAFETYIVPIYNEAKTDFTREEVVIFASVVEREAANESERATVASVFYNRMERDMTLSSCATVQYIIKERKPILSNSDIKIKSPYNTYINKGLPVGPVASPGVNSVKAVLYPADTDYLYFAARADGSENIFSRTGEEHFRVVRELQGN